MTIAAIAKKLLLCPLTEPFNESSVISDCYIGDLLSWVMGRAPAECVWVTVMGNANAIAVARLADISAIILCENSPLDDEAKKQATLNRIPVYQCGKTAFEIAAVISRMLEEKP